MKTAPDGSKSPGSTPRRPSRECSYEWSRPAGVRRRLRIDEDVHDVEADTRTLFEEQFGTTFEDLTGYAARTDRNDHDGHGRDH